MSRHRNDAFVLLPCLSLPPTDRIVHRPRRFRQRAVLYLPIKAAKRGLSAGAQHNCTAMPFRAPERPRSFREDDALSTVFTWNSKVPTIGGQEHRYIDTSRHGVILGWAFDGTVLSHGIAKCVRAALQILPALQASELGMLDAPRTGARNCRAQGLGNISYNGGRRRNLK
jgi:hypothetical protein